MIHLLLGMPPLSPSAVYADELSQQPSSKRMVAARVSPRHQLRARPQPRLKPLTYTVTAASVRKLRQIVDVPALFDLATRACSAPCVRLMHEGRSLRSSCRRRSAGTCARFFSPALRRLGERRREAAIEAGQQNLLALAGVVRIERSRSPGPTSRVSASGFSRQDDDRPRPAIPTAPGRRAGCDLVIETASTSGSASTSATSVVAYFAPHTGSRPPWRWFPCGSSPRAVRTQRPA